MAQREINLFLSLGFSGRSVSLVRKVFPNRALGSIERVRPCPSTLALGLMMCMYMCVHMHAHTHTHPSPLAPASVYEANRKCHQPH